jgi:hypothetical protein
VVEQHPMDMLRALGSVSQLRAERGRGDLRRPKLNAHIHLPPNFSAFTTVTEAVDRAAAQGVRVLGGNNYYDWQVYTPFANLCRTRDIFPLYGLEAICMDDGLRRACVRVNDPDNPGKFYLNAKGLTKFAPMSPTAEQLVEVIRRQDTRRIAAMIDRTANVFAARGLPVPVSERSVLDMVRRRHGLPVEAAVYLQERHVAQAFQEALAALVPSVNRPDVLRQLLDTDARIDTDNAVAVQGAIRTHLLKAGRPGYEPETYVDFDHVHQLVLALGGIPCYTVVADGMQPVSEFERNVDQLIAAMRERRIFCSELIPTRNSPQVVDRYTRSLRAAGLIVLAGTEHNTLDMVPIEPTCAGGTPIPDELQDIYWEGTCVVAAHQFLAAHGETGFVDSTGQPNSTYANDAERIRAFAALGAAVIGAFFSTIRS